MEARIIGNGHPDYLWSATVIGILLNAIVCLLSETVTNKPTIQTLDDDEGLNAYIASGSVIITIRTHPKEGRFSIIAHSNDDFSPEALAVLAIGYLKAKNMTFVKNNKIIENNFEENEPPTNRLYIKVDSSAQWRLMESKFDEEDVIVFTPDQKIP